MVLKQVRYADMLDKKRSRLETLYQRSGGIKNKAEKLEKELDNAKTDEEIDAVSESANELDKESKELHKEIDALKEEINFLEKELADIENFKPDNMEEIDTDTETKGGKRSMRNRSLSNMETYLRNDNVRSFYSNVKRSALENRSVQNGGLTVPTEVLDRVVAQIGDYTNLYAEVDVQVLHGDARVILDGGIPEAIWTEMTGAINELEMGLNYIELDGYKLGGYVSVPNSFLDDSLVKLAMYVEKRLAQAIAKALDKAILNGEGSSKKQPEGIIPAISEENKLTIDGSQGSILSSIALVDSGETEAGEVIAVMKRKTYYQDILPQSIVNTADGRQVVQGVDNPNIAGLRVVFSQNVPEGSIVLGDFKQYLLSERASVLVENSEHVMFIEDQKVFKGTARYDGKVKNANAFALLTIVTPLEA